MASGNPAGGLRCAGIWLLIFGILGGLVSPSGSLWAFIIGCVLVCCSSGDEGLKKNAGCAKCLAITGLVFACIAVIVFIGLGAWLFTAQNVVCSSFSGAVSMYCSGTGRRLTTAMDMPPSSPPMPPGGSNANGGAACDSTTCPPSWISDGMCDSTCNNAACNFDAGDCDMTGTECAPGCGQAWVSDGMCDSPCNNAACNYDGGDCGSNANSGGGGYMRGNANRAQNCAYAQSLMNNGCGWLTTLASVVLIVPTLLHLIYIIGFSSVVCRASQLMAQEAAKPPTFNDVQMDKMSGV
jgi:hypothetical protein